MIVLFALGTTVLKILLILSVLNDYNVKDFENRTKKIMPTVILVTPSPHLKSEYWDFSVCVLQFQCSQSHLKSVYWDFNIPCLIFYTCVLGISVFPAPSQVCIVEF